MQKVDTLILKPFQRVDAPIEFVKDSRYILAQDARGIWFGVNADGKWCSDIVRRITVVYEPPPQSPFEWLNPKKVGNVIWKAQTDKQIKIQELEKTVQDALKQIQELKEN